jgi:hypothetical protein
MCVFGGDGGKGDGRGLWRVASSTSLLTAVGTHWGPIATRGTLRGVFCQALFATMWGSRCVTPKTCKTSLVFCHAFPQNPYPGPGGVRAQQVYYQRVPI